MAYLDRCPQLKKPSLCSSARAAGDKVSRFIPQKHSATVLFNPTDGASTRGAVPALSSSLNLLSVRELVSAAVSKP